MELAWASRCIMLELTRSFHAVFVSSSDFEAGSESMCRDTPRQDFVPLQSGKLSGFLSVMIRVLWNCLSRKMSTKSWCHYFALKCRADGSAVSRSPATHVHMYILYSASLKRTYTLKCIHSRHNMAHLCVYMSHTHSPCLACVPFENDKSRTKSCKISDFQFWAPQAS